MSGRLKSVLVAEGNDDDRQITGRLLKREGYGVVEADNGDVAWREVVRSAPGAVLMGAGMVDASGVDLCRRIKETPDLDWMPVLVFVACDDRGQRLRALEAGANDVIAKPFDPDELALRVRNAVESGERFKGLRRACEKIREQEKGKDDLIDMVVHDMRAPLMVVKGYQDLVWDEVKDAISPELRGLLREAMADTFTLIRMVHCLHDLKAIESGDTDLDLGTHDIVDLMEEAIESLEPVDTAPPVLWKRPQTPIQATVDEKLTGRILANLVAHARRNTPEEGRVVVEAALFGAEARVMVSHPGVLIPEEQREEVFLTFGQARSWRQKRIYSAGLGLAFCKMAVELQGGRIGVRELDETCKLNSAESGNTFWITLPCRSGREG